MADIEVHLDTPANQGVKAGDPGTAQASTDDDEFDDQNPTPWGSVGAPKGSVIKNASRYTITDIHIRRTDGKKFDRKSSGGKAFPNAPQFSNSDTEIEFSGGSVKPGDEFWMKVPEAPQPTTGRSVYTGYLTPVHRPKTSLLLPEPNRPEYAIRSFDCWVEFDADTRALTFARAPVSQIEYGLTFGPERARAPLTIGLSSLTLAPTESRDRSAVSAGVVTIERERELVLFAGFPCASFVLDDRMPGFDSVLAARLSFVEYASDWPNSPSVRTLALYLRSAIFSVTKSFTDAGGTVGLVTISAAPAPREHRDHRTPLAVVNTAGERSVFILDRFIGTLVATGVPLTHARDLAEAVSSTALALPRREVSTDDLRRVSDLARDNPFRAPVADILDAADR